MKPDLNISEVRGINPGGYFVMAGEGKVVGVEVSDAKMILENMKYSDTVRYSNNNLQYRLIIPNWLLSQFEEYIV